MERNQTNQLFNAVNTDDVDNQLVLAGNNNFLSDDEINQLPNTMPEEEETGSYNIEKNTFESENFIEESNETNENLNNIPSGVSIESASYIENNNLKNNENITSTLSNENEEEFTPKLFSDDQSYQSEENLETNDPKDNDTDQLFDQDLNEEEDFEIPAFLRKQKF